MKTHPLLGLLGNNYAYGKILGIRKQISVLESSGALFEKELGESIAELFSNNYRYPDHEKALGIEIFKKETSIGTILFDICTRIAQSKGKYYNVNDESPNGLINWGSKTYGVKKLDFDEFLVDGKLEALNTFLKTFGVKLIFHYFFEYENDKSIKEAMARIEIQIFPDFNIEE